MFSSNPRWLAAPLLGLLLALSSAARADGGDPAAPPPGERSAPEGAPAPDGAPAPAPDGAPAPAPDGAPAPGPAVAAIDWEHALARVDGVAILRTEVRAQMALGVPEAQALQRLVTREVLRSNLLREGRDPAAVPAAELDAALEETREALRARGAELEVVLARSGQTVAQVRDELRIPLAFREYVREQLDEDRLRQVYGEKALALSGEVRASHLLVRRGADRDAEARARALLKELGPDPAPEAFAALARERSDDPMAPLTGGDLDWFAARGGARVPRAVAAAAFSRGEAGLVPHTVASPEGVHLVFVTGTRLPAGATFERLRPQLVVQAEMDEAGRVMDVWLARTPVQYAPDAPPRAAPALPPGSPTAPPAAPPSERRAAGPVR